jgi:BirA family biotin operon repressor/biotin-[acetyl-CoA-carboxylase] ligase
MNSLHHIGRRQIHFEVTDSTNSRAAELAHDPTYAGTVVTADLQSQGRGQHGRVWESLSGVNVLLSTLLFPPTDLRRPAILTAFAAVSVAETILEVTGHESTIKWPNDVLLNGKKVCGILIESGVTSGARSASEVGAASLAFASRFTEGVTVRAPHFIVGIGLNVNQTAEDFSRLGLPDASSLSIVEKHALDVKEITEVLIRHLDGQYERLLRGDIESLEACWASRLGLLGENVRAELMNASAVCGQLTELTFRRLTVAQVDGETRHLVPEEVRRLRRFEITRGQ